MNSCFSVLCASVMSWNLAYSNSCFIVREKSCMNKIDSLVHQLMLNPQHLTTTWYKSVFNFSYGKGHCIVLLALPWRNFRCDGNAHSTSIWKTLKFLWPCVQENSNGFNSGHWSKQIGVIDSFFLSKTLHHQTCLVSDYNTSTNYLFLYTNLVPTRYLLIGRSTSSQTFNLWKCWSFNYIASTQLGSCKGIVVFFGTIWEIF